MKTVKMPTDTRDEAVNLPGLDCNPNISNQAWFENYDESQNALKLYMREILKYPLLKQKRVIELLGPAKSGNLKARDIIIRHNLRLVVWQARRYRGRLKENSAINLLDLIQEGNLGLLRATEMYNESFQTKFSTYAVLWIRSFINRALDNYQKIIRRPVYLLQNVSDFNSVLKQMSAELSREPTNEEIAQKMETTVEQVINIKDSITQSFSHSLNSSFLSNNGEGNQKLSDVIAGYQNEGPRTIDDIETRQVILRDFKKFLSPRESEIIVMRFGLSDTTPRPQTLEVIGDKFGITRERIRQIESKVLDKISYLPNFVRIGLAIGIRISPEIMCEARRRVKIAHEQRRAEIIEQVEALYSMNKGRS